MSDLAAAAAAIETEAQGIPPPSGTTRPGEGTAASPGAGELAAAVAGAPDYDGDARDLVGFLCDGLSVAHPRLDAIYTEPARNRIAERLARVMEKYQWDLSMFGPELMLAAVLAPAVVSTAKIMRQDWAADKAQQPRIAPAAAPLVTAAPANDRSPDAPAAPAPIAAPVNPEAIKKVQGDQGANLFKKA